MELDGYPVEIKLKCSYPIGQNRSTIDTSGKYSYRVSYCIWNLPFFFLLTSFTCTFGNLLSLLVVFLVCFDIHMRFSSSCCCFIDSLIPFMLGVGLLSQIFLGWKTSLVTQLPVNFYFGHRFFVPSWSVNFLSVSFTSPSQPPL